MSVAIIGSFISPYVRKVLAALHLKGIAYEVDPIVPFFGNDEFSRLSPLRRIPVLRDRLRMREHHTSRVQRTRRPLFDSARLRRLRLAARFAC